MARTVAGPGLSGSATASSVAVRIGLPVASLTLGRGLGEARVLALVVGDDALEAVVGVEAALPHQPRLVRLDAEAEVDDGVDVGVRGDQLAAPRGWCRGSRRRRRSTGLLRLHRGGSFVVDRGPQVVGQRQQVEVAVRGDGVGGDDAPAAGGGDARRRSGPVGSGWVAKVAAASNASSTVAARMTPAWRHTPSKTRSSAASAPVWLAAARWPARGGAALHEHDAACVGDRRASRVEEAAAVGDALDVGQGHRGGGVVGVEVEVVGDADRGGVAGRDRPADADAGLARRSS